MQTNNEREVLWVTCMNPQVHGHVACGSECLHQCKECARQFQVVGGVPVPTEPVTLEYYWLEVGAKEK